MLTNPGIRFGLLGGFTVVALYTLVYTVDKDAYHHTGLYYGSLTVYAWFMFLASRSDISVNGSARDFRELVKIPFITFLITNCVSGCSITVCICTTVRSPRWNYRLHWPG